MGITSHVHPKQHNKQKSKQLRHHLDLFTALSISTHVFRIRIETLTPTTAKCTVRKICGDHPSVPLRPFLPSKERGRGSGRQGKHTHTERHVRAWDTEREHIAHLLPGQQERLRWTTGEPRQHHVCSSNTCDPDIRGGSSRVTGPPATPQICRGWKHRERNTFHSTVRGGPGGGEPLAVSWSKSHLPRGTVI